MARWLLLIHRIPPKPSYFRAKILRRLRVLGSVAIKKSVYALPKNEQTLEDFQWVLREIVQGGGEASLCEGDFVEGLTDEQVRVQFLEARTADYAQICEEARSIFDFFPPTSAENEKETDLRAQLARLKKRFLDVTAIDFFEASGRAEAEGILLELEERLKGASTESEDRKGAIRIVSPEDLRNRTWVTRKDVHIDRIASGWLIRNFIDPNARFRFVASENYQRAPDEIRFDMFEAEFTHEGERCTFEVLVAATGLKDPALQPIAEIVHDIDLKDKKFRREEAFGLARLIDGLTMAHRADEGRLERGGAIFDDLYAYFRRNTRAPRQDKRGRNLHA